MEIKLKNKLDSLVRINRLDQARVELRKAGYSEHRAGLLIHVAIKATITQPELPIPKVYDGAHICISCG